MATARTKTRTLASSARTTRRQWSHSERWAAKSIGAGLVSWLLVTGETRTAQTYLVTLVALVAAILAGFRAYDHWVAERAAIRSKTQPLPSSFKNAVRWLFARFASTAAEDRAETVDEVVEPKQSAKRGATRGHLSAVRSN